MSHKQYIIVYLQQFTNILFGTVIFNITGSDKRCHYNIMFYGKVQESVTKSAVIDELSGDVKKRNLLISVVPLGPGPGGT